MSQDHLDVEPEIPLDLDVEPEDPLGGALDVEPAGVSFAGKTCQETTGMVGETYLRCGAPAVMLVQHRGRSEGPYFMCLGCGTHNARNRNGVIIARAEEPALDVEPEPAAAVATGAGPESAGAVAPLPTPVAAPIAELLPADFPLPTLIKFVPKIELKWELDAAVKYANSLDIKNGGQAAVDAGDAAVTALKNVIKAIEADFYEPCSLFDLAHKSVTKKRAEWTADGVATVKLVGRRVADEVLRLGELAREQRRRDQDEENRKARENAAREVEAAKAGGAPAAVVEQLQEQAQTAIAPPVATHAPTPPRTNTVVKKWKARIKGTPADADPHPPMRQITPAQRPHVLALLKAILDGKEQLTLIDFNWTAINDRAKSDESTFNITGLEAYVDTGLRAKPGARR